tara:strand:- start:4439 stop:6247 length:1809 start_codon:yes stop_codon:yes gene_type:complete
MSNGDIKPVVLPVEDKISQLAEAQARQERGAEGPTLNPSWLQLGAPPAPPGGHMRPFLLEPTTPEGLAIQQRVDEQAEAMREAYAGSVGAEPPTPTAPPTPPTGGGGYRRPPPTPYALGYPRGWENDWLQRSFEAETGVSVEAGSPEQKRLIANLDEEWRKNQQYKNSLRGRTVEIERGQFDLEAAKQDAQIAAGRQQAEADAEAARLLGEAAERERAHAEQMEAEREEHNVSYALARADLKQAHGDLKSKRINPNRFWQRAGTGGKIAAILGVMFGSLGGSLTNRPNEALGILNKAIDDDLNAQAANLRHERSALGEQRGLLADMRRIFSDEQTAKAAAKSVYMRSIENRAKQQILMSKSKIGEDQARRAAENIQKARELHEQGFEARRAGEILQARQRRAQGAAWARTKAERDRERQKYSKTFVIKDLKSIGVAPSGQEYLFNGGASAAAKYTAGNETRKKVLTSLGQMKHLVSRGVTTGKEHSEYVSLYQRVRPMLAKLQEQGMLGVQEGKEMGAQMGVAVTDWTPTMRGDAKAALNQTYNSILGDANTAPLNAAAVVTTREIMPKTKGKAGPGRVRTIGRMGSRSAPSKAPARLTLED